MKKNQNNYAFVDGTNLYLALTNSGWQLDLKRFRIYLNEHYGVTKAYYFIGYAPENTSLYLALQSYGFVLVHKPTLRLPNGQLKGNCDAEMVLQAMIDLNEYEKAVLVTSDGDFYCLVNYLNKLGKLECVMAPRKDGCSHLLTAAARERMRFMDNLRDKLEYKRKDLHKDGTL